MEINEKSLITRLFNVQKTYYVGLDTLLSISNIVIDNQKTKTACVTVGNNPTLYFNSDFIKKHCKSDEHLFMLTMHEMMHVLLGHTSLFKSPSVIDNIVYDAIINAYLCNLFDDSEYTSFFTQFYSPQDFPSCILRPKSRRTPEEYKEILDMLYNSNNCGYEDIYELFKDLATKHQIKVMPLLLGNHEFDEIDELGSKEFLKEHLKGFDDKLFQRKTRNIELNITASEKLPSNLKYLLDKTLCVVNSNIYQKRNVVFQEESFLPNYKDRLHYAKESLLGESLIYKSDTSRYELDENKAQKAFVYLDVSGSVQDEYKRYLGDLVNYLSKHELEVYLFSTKVEKINPKELGGFHPMVDGTDINAVLSHYLSVEPKDRPGKILIITDGYTGMVNPYIKEQIRQTNVTINVGLITNVHTDKYIQDIAACIREV